MSMVIEKRPKMSDENLFALFHNAERALSKEPNLAAESVIKAIEHEWKERLDRARAGTRSTATPNDGMLVTLGYRVGSVNGEKAPIFDCPDVSFTDDAAIGTTAPCCGESDDSTDCSRTSRSDGKVRTCNVLAFDRVSRRLGHCQLSRLIVL
jgi:hypothetical protein